MIIAIITKNFQFVAHYGGVHGALRISLKSFIKAEVEFYISGGTGNQPKPGYPQKKNENHALFNLASTHLSAR